MKLQASIKVISYIFFMFIVSITSKAQSVTDYDGNVYQTVIIGEQIWMAENLKTTHYSEGVPIEDGALIGTVLMDDTTKLFYYYNNNPAYMERYGLLYNWYASVNGTTGSSNNPSDIKGICPAGWHIPSLAEWGILEAYLGDTIAESLVVNGGSGFNALFAGVGGADTPFQQMGGSSAFISSDGDNDPYSHVDLKFITNGLNYFTGNHSKVCGYSVRCVKDHTEASGILKAESNGIFKLYPNPTSGIINVDYDKSFNIKSAYLLNINGQILKILTELEQIHVEDFAPGIYLLLINYDDKNIIKKCFLSQ